MSLSQAPAGVPAMAEATASSAAAPGADVSAKSREPKIGFYAGGSDREVARLELLLRRFTPTCIVAPRHTVRGSRTMPVVQDHVADIDILVALGNEPPEAPGKRIWLFAVGHPGAVGESAVRQALSSGAARVGIALIERGTAGDKIIAFESVPVRRWDKEAAVAERMELCLPQLLRDALDRIESGLEGVPIEAWPSEVGANAALEACRLAFPKYWIHRAVMPLARSRPEWIASVDQTRIVVMHTPAPDILDEILSTLSCFGDFISLDAVLSALMAGREPPHGFVVTFDDGCRQNLALLDVLDRHGCSAVFYISTRPLGTRRPLWFMNPRKAGRRHKAALKVANYRGFLALSDRLGLTDVDELHWRFGLTLDEIKEIAARGHHIGVHTVNHPFLTRLSAEEIRREVGEAFAALKEAVGNDELPFDFAYPDGDYDARVVDVLRSMAVRSAVTARSGSISIASDRLAMPRFSIDDCDYSGYAAFKLTRLFQVLKKQVPLRTERILRVAQPSVP